MKNYRETKQPRITVSKKDCNCSVCDAKIEQGEAIKFNPETKEVNCSKCFKKSK